MTQFKTIEDLINGIDFKMLKKQKKDLVSVIGHLESSAKTVGKVSESSAKEIQDQADSLQGILNTIDNLQDLAVDVYGEDENEVFDIEE